MPQLGGGQVRLADLTTLHVGGAAADYVVAETEAELVSSITAADAMGEPLLVLGGGSNLLVCDDGFPGRVVCIATSGTTTTGLADDRVAVSAAAGLPWGPFVSWAVAEGLSGLEMLAGIPGLVGATPVQNVGAYGGEVADTILSMRVLDRATGTVGQMPAAQAGFGYRTSRFKKHPGRWVVLEVTFALARTELAAPLRYAELARTLGAQVGDTPAITEVRDAVIELRRGKGMLYDPEDHDTWSAGSFFTNPLITAEQAATLPEGVPSYPQADGRVKVSAAWLIDHAGFHRGFRLEPDAPAGLSRKHVLALTNRGGATADDLLSLARAIRIGVAQDFGITLENEPVLVGCSL
jgi:UDP-N-acetylmuramate dehydrogenase